MGTGPPPRSFPDLKPGDHLCCIYESEEEHRAVLTPYLIQGLERREKVLYIVDAHTAEAVLDYLRERALDVDSFLASGQLAILTRADAYLRDGRFDPDRMLDLLRSETERALAEGWTALRVTGEMTWALRGEPGSERLIEYESRLNEFFPGSRCLAICQYDRRRFAPEVLLDVLHTHPFVLLGTRLFDNSYYLPPAAFLGDRAAGRFEQWTRALTGRAEAEQRIRFLNRLYRTISEVNQLIVREKNPRALFAQVCRIVVQHGEFRMAWIGLVDRVAGDVAPVATSGAGADFVTGGHLSLDPAAGPLRPPAQAVHEGRPVVVDDTEMEPRFGPWREAAAARGLRSCAAVPFRTGGQVRGVVAVYAGEPGMFTSEVVALFEELAGDLGHALAAIETERALGRSEELYRSLVAASPDGVGVIDERGRAVFASPKIYEMLGRDPARDLAGLNALDWLATEDRSRAAAEIAELARGKVVVGASFALVRDDGSRLAVDISGGPVGGTPSRPRGVVLILRDATLRRQAEAAVRASEQALRKREAELRESQRLAHIGSWDWDAAGDTIWWSDEYYRIYGISPDDPRPNYAEHLKAYARESAERLDTAVKRAMATGEPYELDLELARPTISTRWVVARGEARRDASGAICGLRGTAQDITERRLLEEQMRRSATAIEQLAETIMVTDLTGTIEYVNPAFTRLTGYSREEAVGKNPRILNSGKQSSAFYREMWDTLLRGEVWHGHVVNRRKDGTLFEEDATISPVRDDSGAVAHYVAVKRDVTQEAALEAQLRQSQKMEAVGRLAGGIAHDFNNLLQAMLSHTQLLRRAPERAAADLAELEAQIRRGAALTRQLLLFSRHEQARREPIDLNDVVREAGGLLRRLVRENVEVVVETPEGPVVAAADRGQLDQVLMNLTLNAADAMPDGGRLTIRAGTTGDDAWLAVQDTGHGIPEAIRDKVFEPFFTTKPAGHGTGLGLSVVHGIVAEHGGRTELESAVGAGTTVRVLLPRLAPEALRAEAPARPEEPLPAGRHERVLVVEDEPAAREGLADILRSLGYEVTAVGSAAETRDLVPEGPFHVLLTDLMLPDVDGAALARGLLDRWPGLRVILMSGYAEEDVRRRGAELAEVEFLQKPFDIHALAHALRRVLDAG